MSNNDCAALDSAFSVAYGDLRRMVRKIISGTGGRESSATSLVNEAWLKLSSATLSSRDDLHWRRTVAQAMRYILGDAWRRRNSKVRGSGAVLITFDECLHNDCTLQPGRELLALNAALTTLASVSPWQSQKIEARCFGGLKPRRWFSCSRFPSEASFVNCAWPRRGAREVRACGMELNREAAGAKAISSA